MESYEYLKFFMALMFVIALMGGLSFILRKFVPGSAPFIAPKKRRLKIIEMLALDHKRKALLIKRDDREHLVILGPNSEIVVETDIKADDKNDRI